MSRLIYSKANTVIIKIGSAMITNDGQGIDQTRIAQWAEQIAQLKAQGKKIIIVSSGAVAEGMQRLKWAQRPSQLSQLQAAAAIGQMNLAHEWDSAFQKHDIITAQILLTHEDAADRRRYLNIKATLETLLEFDAIPIINENDTVAFEEIRFGDNDTLGALVANLIDAELYVILTDQQGLYNKDPRKHSDAKFLSEVKALDPALLEMAGDTGGNLGRGGMYTKVKAAQKAAFSGTATWIAYGRHPNVLLAIANGDDIGTLFTPEQSVLAARKRWMLNQMQSKGEVTLDHGAVNALLTKGTSLLPIGISAVNGNFHRGDIIICIDAQGKEIGRGISNYSASEIQKIKGFASSKIEEILGFSISEEVIHRNNWIEQK